MLVGDKLNYPAANEAYCLLTAYIREKKIGAKYNRDDLKEFVNFLAEILKHPENFVEVDRKVRLRQPEEEDTEE